MTTPALPLPMSTAPAVASVDWQPRIGALGEIVEGVEDVLQCVRTILHTPRGSIPLAPDFGCDLYAYLDQPITTSRPQIVRSVIEALALGEPRVEVTRVAVGAVDAGEAAAGALVISVECRVVGTDRTLVVTVPIAGAA